MTTYPLTEFPEGARYRGERGGLYGDGTNAPPPMLLDRAMAAARRIQPLATDGRGAEDGLIGLLAVGFSNAEDQFASFMRVVAGSQVVAPALRLVNGGQSHMGSREWATGESDRGDPWLGLATRQAEAGLAPTQVQAIWLKLAPRFPMQYGEFPVHVELTTADLTTVISRLARDYPNLKLVYCSSRVYAGHAQTGLNPEPYAYEGAFAIRRLVLGQQELGTSKWPVILWGPYLWADGDRPRADGLRWSLDDFSFDGMHPSSRGAEKVGQLLFQFFQHDCTARPWFLRPG